MQNDKNKILDVFDVEFFLEKSVLLLSLFISLLAGFIETQLAGKEYAQLIVIARLAFGIGAMLGLALSFSKFKEWVTNYVLFYTTVYSLYLLVFNAMTSLSLHFTFQMVVIIAVWYSLMQTRIAVFRLTTLLVLVLFVTENFIKDYTPDVIASFLAFSVTCVVALTWSLRFILNKKRDIKNNTLTKFIADNSSDVLSIIDVNNGSISFISAACQQLLGHTPSEMISKNLLDFVDFRDLDLVKSNFNERNFKESHNVQFVFRMLTKAGSPVWVESNNKATYKEGALSSVISTFRDVDARVKAENEKNIFEDALISERAKLIQSNKALEDFAHIASHDLKEPLRTIASYVQLIQRRIKGVSDPEIEEFVGFTVDGIKKMYQQIDDLLAYSKVGSSNIKISQVSIYSIVNEVAEQLKEVIKEKKASIVVNQLPTINADPFQMRQLFQNLISNALKYSRANIPPLIIIDASDRDDKWEIRVSDNGMGIDSAFADKVFLMFERVHEHAGAEGNGIGLAICKKVVSNHEGRIHFFSKVNHGTTFYLSIAKDLKSTEELEYAK